MISNKQIAAISALAPFDRYRHAIKRIADQEALVTISDAEGYWILSEAEGRVMMSIWSDREYAAHFLSNSGWEDVQIEAITLDEFDTEVRPFLEETGHLLNVHSVDRKSGFCVTLGEFIRDLGDALQAYE